MNYLPTEVYLFVGLFPEVFVCGGGIALPEQD